MPFPINSVFANRNNPDIHRKASNFQFVINDIFHNMSFFEIPETETRIAKTHISRIGLVSRLPVSVKNTKEFSKR